MAEAVRLFHRLVMRSVALPSLERKLYEITDTNSGMPVTSVL